MQRCAEINALNMLRNDYQKTLLLLRALKAGSITLDQVLLIADGWRLTTEAEPQLSVVSD